MAGRPKSIIDWNVVDEYLKAQCDAVGIASILGVNESTLRKRCEEDNKMLFSEYSQQKKSEGKELLRSTMYRNAIAGDRSLLIWLSKQHLGYTDKVVQEIDQTIRRPHDSMTEDERQKRRDELRAKMNADS